MSDSKQDKEALALASLVEAGDEMVVTTEKGGEIQATGTKQPLSRKYSTRVAMVALLALLTLTAVAGAFELFWRDTGGRLSKRQLGGVEAERVEHMRQLTTTVYGKETGDKMAQAVIEAAELVKMNARALREDEDEANRRLTDTKKVYGDYNDGSQQQTTSDTDVKDTLPPVITFKDNSPRTLKRINGWTMQNKKMCPYKQEKQSSDARRRLKLHSKCTPAAIANYRALVAKSRAGDGAGANVLAGVTCDAREVGELLELEGESKKELFRKSQHSKFTRSLYANFADSPNCKFLKNAVLSSKRWLQGIAKSERFAKLAKMRAQGYKIRKSVAAKYAHKNKKYYKTKKFLPWHRGYVKPGYVKPK